MSRRDDVILAKDRKLAVSGPRLVQVVSIEELNGKT